MIAVRVILITSAVCIVALAIGIGIGYGIRDGKADDDKNNVPANAMQQEVDRLAAHAGIIDDLKAVNVKKTLEYLTQEPHVAGSIRNNKLADHFITEWKNAGLENVVKRKYHILLSFPRQPAQVKLFDENNVILEDHTILETPLSDFEMANKDKVIYPFNSYSPSGDETGELVYVNYGRYEDFELLDKIGVNLTGKILISRYGVTARSNKLRRATLYKAAGLLLFSDPADYSTTGTWYPDSWELPDTGIQRGTVMTRQGDALSPEYPSKDGYFRRSISSVDYLPTVPCQPITFAQAETLLRQITDFPLPDPSWQGRLNFTYGIASNTSRTVRMIVNNELESKATYVAEATLYGSVEPDRRIILGNHRDAWAYGAGDASSGSAALLEIGKSLGKKHKTGWRPRRTIMLCSWDAEEYGVMASTEWVEENTKMLRDQAVAYLNVDIAVEGNHTIRYKGMPQLDEAFFHVIKQIKSPDNDKSLFNDWLDKLPESPGSSEPKRSMMNAGSDYKPFMQHIGIPCVDLRYFFDRTQLFDRMYPMYHTMHDTFEWMTRFVDPDGRYHASVAKMWTGLALYLADTTLLKFGLKRYADRTMAMVDKFEASYQEVLNSTGLKLDKLRSMVSALQTSTADFENSLQNVNLNDPLAVRMVNDKMLYFERSFIHSYGLPIAANKMYSHVIMASSSYVMKGGNRFNGLGEALTQIYRKQHNNMELAHTEMALIIYHIEMAIASLQDMPK